MNVRTRVRNSIVGLVLATAAIAAASQEMDPIEILGGFDRIAEACTPDRSEAGMNAVRIRLYRQLFNGFGGAKDIKGDKDIEALVAATRKRISDDATSFSSRRYEAGRRGTQDIEKIAATEPQQFEQVCKATRPLQP